jgi:hypothetical protein
MKLLMNTTAFGLWFDVIHEAESTCEITLKQELEIYLANLLVRYTSKPQMIKSTLAANFLESIEKQSHQRELGLQEVGDVCLLYSGFFPGLAQKKLVKISYFTNLGQSAYANISTKRNDLFGLLAQQFVSLMDVLQSIRLYSKDSLDLLPIQAYELWTETNSKRALSVLKQYTSAIPIQVDSSER